MRTKGANSIIQDPWARAGLAILLSLLLAAALGPFLLDQSPTAYAARPLSPPSDAHPLGTDDLGQDIMAGLIYGLRTSLTVALGVGLLSTLLAIGVGLAAVLGGRLSEALLMRLTDTLLALPAVLLFLLISTFLRPGLLGLTLMLSALTWPAGARIIRAQALSLKEGGPVLLARASGAGLLHISRCHLLPALFPVLVAGFVVRAAQAVFMEAGLSFLGLSDPEMVSLGTLMADARGFIFLDNCWWWMLPPGLAICLLVVSLTLMGRAWEEVIDPRLGG